MSLRQDAEGLVTALTSPAGLSPAVADRVHEVLQRLSGTLAEYTSVFSSLNAAAFGAAYTYADAVASWAISAANDSTSSPPSPSLGPSFSTFDGSPTLYNDLVTKCATATAACAAPGNGIAPLVTASAMVADALATATTAWHEYLTQPTGGRIANPAGGLPLSVGDSQTYATAALTAIVREAEAVAGALGIAWTPGP
ncbi:MAG TPA: hypothetical protein VE987_21945 [Polyangiaceae bacterium]|nr:hypothetical protein [Polyangiaceae bacterium]